MGLWKSIGGMLELEITSAEPEKTLDEITARGVTVYSARQVSYLTYRIRVCRSDYRKIRDVLERVGGAWQIRQRLGLFWPMKGLLSRPVLLGGIGLLLAASLYLPSRVLFIRVEGNSVVDTREILAAAEACGIRFGASRREVRSEKVKNSLLEKVPDLQWAGVNTAGCVATISVRERQITAEEQAEEAVTHLVAARDGYIVSATVTQGTPLVQVGQTVRAGQTLVSGYTDCNRVIQAGRAEGEIFAQTQREITVVTPAQTLARMGKTKTSWSISLRLGKKQINLWKDSGISSATCGRMYEEYPITLPGGFQLPIAVCVDCYFDGDTYDRDAELTDAQSKLAEFAQDYVTSQMIAGQILEVREEQSSGEDVYTLSVSYTCVEMIGREHPEQMGDINGKASGTYR